MKKRFLASILVIIAVVSLMTGCSRNGNANSNATHIGPAKTAKNTVSAILTNTDYDTGVELNWSTRQGNSAITMSGLQQITFVINGDEMIGGVFQDKLLSSIRLEFTGQTSGKKVSLDTSLVGLATNLAADADYFKVKEKSFYFYPHYFNVGEEVLLKATFTYKAEGLLNSIGSGKEIEGYLVFTVGADTGENFSNPLSDFSNSVKNFFDGLGNNSSTTPDNPDDPNTGNTGSGWKPESGSFYADIRYRVNGKDKDYMIQRYEEDSTKNPVQLNGTALNLTVYSRECTEHDIVKVYLEFPDGTNYVWSNDWYEDNCHKFGIDMSAYAGQSVTIRVRLLAGSELWQNEYMYGFITVQVPKT